MSVENEKGQIEIQTQVVEKRVKPTVIRRRAKKVEVEIPPEAEGAGEAPAPSAAESAGEAAAAAEAAKGEARAALPPQAAEAREPQRRTGTDSIHGPEARGTPGPALSAPSEAERKIGVVGYINLEAAASAAPTPVGAVKDTWRDRLKRGPRRRKSRAEIEMETIERSGGLKQFVGASLEGAEAAAPGFADRVFQPVPSSKKKRAVRREFKKTQVTEARAIKKVIRVEDGISVSALSQALGIKAGEIIKRLMALGVMATVNQAVDPETASLIAEEQGYKVEHTAFKEEQILVEPEAHASASNLVHRPPVVTVMGHVDHGKTSILDVIRKSNVVDGEAGGITQHIGAYEVRHPKGTITFLDTPGHEAFTEMRARGAQATDIVVLVVAADDGIMPQTIEAISHAKAAEVPLIVAINKIDKPDAQPDRVKQGLTEHGLVPEDWGGDVICVPTSAKTKQGLDQLLEMILLQAEVLELKADPTLRAKGIVVEAALDKGRGPVATVLIQEGMLRDGDSLVCGLYEGKVRAMFDAEGKKVAEAGLSKPVAILGLTGVPKAGDEMVAVADDRSAKLVAEQRRQKDRERELTGPIHVSLEDLSKQMAEGEAKQLPVILKADVQGSAEAVSEAIEKLSTDKVRLNILHQGVGGITESDVMLASASNAVVLGFNVVQDSKARQAAEREKIDVRCYRIIYEMIDEVRKAMEGLLAPEEKEVALGQAEVREVFRITKVGSIAGCQVVSGKIQRNGLARLVRDQSIVFEGRLSSLKRFKDDVKEVTEGYECGIGLENFNDIKAGDIIEAYIIEKKA
ncbi:MAG: translation initiation factor IF-2, partial [Proteobacteria bacterium]|nr:translation initiation factor IF-2 [Pseudomonadota bacterium]